MGLYGMNKTLSVSAIQNGSVIDHIPPGQALRIIHMLHLLNKKIRVTVGINLSSHRLKLKDLIKIENYILSHQEANETAIFAPDATINIINNFEVVEKITPHFPDRIRNIFSCPNPVCVSQVETLTSDFIIQEESKKQVNLICKYCEKTFDRNQVIVKI